MSQTFLVVGLLVALSSFCTTEAELNCDIGKFVQPYPTFADLLELIWSGQNQATFYVTATSDKPSDLRGIVVKAVKLADKWFLTHTVYYTNGSCVIPDADFYRFNMVGERVEPSQMGAGKKLNIYLLAGDKDAGYLTYAEVLKDGVKLRSKFNLVTLSPRSKVDPQIADTVLASICDPPVDVQSLFQDLEVDPTVMDGSCAM